MDHQIIAQASNGSFQAHMVLFQSQKLASAGMQNMCPQDLRKRALFLLLRVLINGPLGVI